MDPDFWILDHVAETVDLERVGGEDRVRESLEPGEAILGAAHGWVEQPKINRPIGHGKRKEGVLLHTNRRVLIVLSPGTFSRDPQPLAIAFDEIDNAGTHKELPWVIVMVGTQMPNGGCYFHVADADEVKAEIIGFAIRNGTEGA